MKKLIIICFVVAIAFRVNAQAQNAPLNKQQTLDYIEKLFKASYKFDPDPTIVITSVTLDFKTLQVNLSNGEKVRTLLDDDRLLEVSLQNFGEKNKYRVSFEASTEAKDVMLFNIQNEADAKKLKKALNHLIEILTTEKSTDPFGE